MQQIEQPTIDEYLMQLYREKKMSEETKEKIQRSIERFVKLLSKIKYNTLNPPITNLYHTYFGSMLNGFGTQSSDVDYTILTNSYVNEKQFLLFTKQEIERILLQNQSLQRFKIARFVEHARIPVLNIVDQVEKVDYDLCCNNILGMINTKLLNQYASLHEYVQAGGILLKIWGKAQKIINQNEFSSYQIILMWIAFLQREYNLPNLQDKEYLDKFDISSSRIKICRCRPIDSVDSPQDTFTTNTRFIVEPEEIAERMKLCTITNYKLSELLKEFWKYYQFKDGKFFLENTIISINTNPNQVKRKWNKDKFTTEDPFDVTHDPGQRAKNISEEKLEIFEKSKIIIQKQDLQLVKQLFE